MTKQTEYLMVMTSTKNEENTILNNQIQTLRKNLSFEKKKKDSINQKIKIEINLNKNNKSKLFLNENQLKNVKDLNSNLKTHIKSMVMRIQELDSQIKKIKTNSDF